MSPTRKLARSTFATLTATFLLLLLAASRPARAAMGAEGAAEVRGTVKDMDGNPLEGVEVAMTPLGKDARPFVVKTRKDGSFVFPFLPYNKERYSAAFRKEGYKIRKIHIKSRHPESSSDRGAGQIVQDDEGTVGVDQKIPPVNAKPGGTVSIEAGMATQEFFDKLAEARAAAEPGTAPAGTGSAAAQAPPQAQLDPVDEAQRLASDGKFDEATEVLKKAIQEEPTAQKWLELGKLRVRASDPDGAKLALGRCAGLDPKIRGAHFLLGKLYNDDGRTPQAIDEMEKELELDQENVPTLKALGILYPQASRTNDAIRVYEKLAAQSAGDSEILARLAALYGELGNYSKAEETYRKILQMNPGQADVVYFKLGQSIKNQSNFGEPERKRAADAFQRAIEANPGNARAHLELAYVLVGLGDIPKAKEHFKRFLELQPNSPEATEVRATLKELG